MAPPGVQLDRETVAQQAHAMVRALLVELGSPTLATQDLATAHLERDLGLGSLERVELMLRLDTAFGIQLPEHTVAEANTVADLVDAVREAGGHAIEPRAAQTSANNGSSVAAIPFAPAVAESYPDRRSGLRRVLEGIYGVYALAVFALLLGGVFYIRFRKTKKMMPTGLMLGVSALTAVTLVIAALLAS